MIKILENLAWHGGDGRGWRDEGDVGDVMGLVMEKVRWLVD